MTPKYLNRWSFIIVRLLSFLVLFFLSQIVFIILQAGYWDISGISECWAIFHGMLRFMTSTICWIFPPFILWYILPLNLTRYAWFGWVGNILYSISAIAILSCVSIDWVYYGFTGHHMTSGILEFMAVTNTFTKLLPSFISDFWPYMLLFFLFVAVLFGVQWYWRCKHSLISGWYAWLKNIILCVVFLALCVLGMRGGFQYRPLNMFHAQGYSSRNVDCVTNSAFTFMKSLTNNVKMIEPVSYYTSESSLEQAYNPVSPAMEGQCHSRPNVVIIALESFSAEYIGALNGGLKSYTPFLDSLLPLCHNFVGYANGATSMDGIVSLLSGLPTLLDEIYILSQYSRNRLNSIGSVLVDQGYSTHFFHGGFDGTLGLDMYTKGVGFKNYYGASAADNGDEQIQNKEWGIHDHYFMPWAGKKMSTLDSPFCAVLYSLSSHHPFVLPTSYQGRFDKGTLDIHEAIGYSDYALQLFFEEAKKWPNFDNTLFIITADHSASTESDAFRSVGGRYRIPMAWYFPAVLKPKQDTNIMQHIDVLPSLHAFLGHKKPVIAFGRNVWVKDSLRKSYQKPFHISYRSSVYHLLRDSVHLQFSNLDTYTATKIDGSPVPQVLIDDQLDFIKALIQQYNHRLLNNEFHH